MSQRYQYVTVERVLAKHSRDMRGLDIHESDVLEWVGEALSFMKIPNVSEEAVAFMEVEDHQAQLPCNFHYITQVAKYADADNFSINEVIYDGATTSPSIINILTFSLLPTTETVDTIYQVTSDTDTTLNGYYTWNDTAYVKNTNNSQLGVCLDEYGNLIEGTEYAYYRPYFDLQYEYLDWMHSNVRRTSFTPVKLADHTFFNSVVCQEEDDRIQHLYNSCNDEYTVVQKTRKLRFSFKKGFVAVAFTRQMIDEATGYPMVPDNQYCLNAIEYYLKWKTMERHFYLGREGSQAKMMYAEDKWEKYIHRFKNHSKMPMGVDDFEDLKNQSNYLIPRGNMYDNYFGSLSDSEPKTYTHPKSNYNRR